MPRFVPVSPDVLQQIGETMWLDREAGVVMWMFDNRAAKAQAGDPVGHVRVDGRRIVYVRGRILYVSQIAAFLRDNAWPTERVWCIDGNRDNLRPENLHVGRQHPLSQERQLARDREREAVVYPWSHVPPTYWKFVCASVPQYKQRFDSEAKRRPVDDFALRRAEQDYREHLLLKLEVLCGGNNETHFEHCAPFKGRSLRGLEELIPLLM